MERSDFTAAVEMQIGPYAIREASVIKSVYFGRHSETGRQVVLKEATPPKDFEGDIAKRLELGRRLLRYEHSIQSRLKHPNICPVDELLEYNGDLYLVTPQAGQHDFAFCQRDLPLEDKLTVLEDLANALIHCHENKIVHLDVKGENVIVFQGRGTLIDFDAAREIRKPHPVSNDIRIYTPETVAPEYHKKGHYAPRSDVFSWAVTAYEALTGEMPFDKRGRTLNYDKPKYDARKVAEFGALGAFIIASFDLRYKRRPQMKEIADAVREQIAKPDPQPSEETSEPCLVSC